jgi:ssDNA-binding Zn-finger/Zn-ribbon topoisomerase 1
MKKSTHYLNTKCPWCGEHLIKRQNKISKEFFIGCSNYPKCKFIKKKDAIDYACETLGIEWRPNISDSAKKVLEKCQSRDEKEYLIGAAYYLDNHEEGCATEQMEIDSSTIPYTTKNYHAIIFIDPYKYYGGGSVPSAIAFIPQFEFGNTLHHDFGIFFSNYRFGSNENWYMGLAIEVDVHPSHYYYNSQDKYRDSVSPYTVLRLDPFIDKPLSWFAKVINYWNRKH